MANLFLAHGFSVDPVCVNKVLRCSFDTLFCSFSVDGNSIGTDPTGIRNSCFFVLSLKQQDWQNGSVETRASSASLEGLQTPPAILSGVHGDLLQNESHHLLSEVLHLSVVVPHLPHLLLCEGVVFSCSSLRNAAKRNISLGLHLLGSRSSHLDSARCFPFEERTCYGLGPR